VTERARTVSTLVLCVVMVGALAMILLVLPGLDSAPEPTEVSLDFGTFVPGEAQVRTTALDVPTGSVVREAGVATSTSRSSCAPVPSAARSPSATRSPRVPTSCG
jgi:hypothetical protein